MDRRVAGPVLVLALLLGAALVVSQFQDEESRDDAPATHDAARTTATGTTAPPRDAQAASPVHGDGSRLAARERQPEEPAVVTTRTKPSGRIEGIGPTLRRPGGAVQENIRPPADGGGSDDVRAADWTPATTSRTPVAGLAPDTSAAPADAKERTESEDPEPEATLPSGPARGLLGEYFDLVEGDIRHIPSVTGLTPTFRRIDPAIDFDDDDAFALPFEAETYLVRWTGFLHVLEEATYRFTCGSDDGARLVIDGKYVIDQPNLRAYAESSGKAALSAGRHEIEVVFYENRVYASCRLWWDGPNWSRRIVPTEILSPPAPFADVTPPSIASLSPASGLVDDVVTIGGAGFSGDASQLTVTFRGVPAPIVAASPAQIVVKVPGGASTGDVVVRSGALSSLPRRFTVTNLLGLYAEYYRFTGELHDYPDFEHAAPYFVRLDPNLDFMSDNLWDLPYVSDVFATRHTGFLYVPEEDDYRITLGSDDGARVTLDGARYLEIPGLHPYAEVSETTHLAAGFHSIEVIFFENYGEARLALYWQRAKDVTRSVIPAGFFYAPRALTDLPVPRITSLGAVPAEIGSELEITGTGFGADATLVRVVFPGDVWSRPASVDDTRIRVRVPYGVESGVVRVEVGIQASNSRRFEVATPQGLVAGYIVFPDKASIDAALADRSFQTRPANVTRVETSWQRPGLRDWKLPFEMPHFVVHWQGTLANEFPADINWILRSAAGAVLSVDGKVAVSSPPWHELQENYGSSHLAPGEHRFDLWLAQSGAEPRIQLLYAPVGRVEHLPVPARWFLPREPQ